MELGPCRVSAGGNHTENNAYAWNQNAHLLFIDQPLNSGFSYGQRVDNSYDAAKDIDVFLRMFYREFPEYASTQLHLFGESYAGRYIPAIAKSIHKSNQQLKNSPLNKEESNVAVLPLLSIGMGNALVDPKTQYKYYSKMACDSTYPPVLSQLSCSLMDLAYPLCSRLVDACYYWQNRLACAPAELFCELTILSPYRYENRHNNPYDVRTPCKESSDMCYDIDNDIEVFLNTPTVQQELGVSVPFSFSSCSKRVNLDFLTTGDWVKPIHLEIPPLLEAGLRVLIYSGDADWICNWYGGKAWSLAMDWSGKSEFAAALDRPWLVDGEQAGESRTAGNFTFVRVFGAGHMVPYDQPKASLDMVNSWISNQSKF